MKYSVAFFFIFYTSWCLAVNKFQRRNEIILERVAVLYSDTDYVLGAQGSVGRLGRTSNYLMNFSMNIIRPWYNNVTVSVKSYEFKDNQYKESIIQATDKICDMFQKPFIWFPLRTIQKFSNVPRKCPMYGYIYILNFEIGFEDFPKNFPSSTWLFNVSMTHTSSKKLIGAGSAIIKFQSIKAHRGRNSSGVLPH